MSEIKFGTQAFTTLDRQMINVGCLYITSAGVAFEMRDMPGRGAVRIERTYAPIVVRTITKSEEVKKYTNSDEHGVCMDQRIVLNAIKTHYNEFINSQRDSTYVYIQALAMAIFISKLTSGKVKIEICDHYKKYGASTVQPPVTVYSNLTIRSGNNQTDDQDTAPVEDYQASAVCNGSFATFISCLNYMMANYENEFPNGPHKTKVITYTSFANYAKYLDWLFLDVSVLALQAKDIRFCLNRQNLRLEYALEIGEHCV